MKKKSQKWQQTDLSQTLIYLFIAIMDVYCLNQGVYDAKKLWNRHQEGFVFKLYREFCPKCPTLLS